MKKNTLALATALALGSVLSVAHANEAAQSSVEQVTPKAITYPITQKVDVVDDYFGTKVSDPYRWLEDDLSPETAEWVKAQNAVTFDYLSKIPYREQIEERITKLMDYEKQSQPFKEGKFTYFYKNDGLQNQDVLYRQLGDGEAEIFLDPNTFSEDGTTSLAGVSFSRDGSLVAYSISEGGSDWRKVIVLDTETKKPVGETLVDIKFSGISWLGNQGFYYSSYDKPQGSELSAKTDQHKLYFHKLGTKQNEDQLIFGGFEEEKYRYVGGYTSDDERYLFISASVSTSGNKLFFKDLSKPNSPLKTILDNTSSDTWVIDNQGTKLYLVTNLNAPNKRVVTVDASQPQPKNWKDLITETKNVLRVSTAGGNLFASYIVDAISMVKQYDMNGKLIREIKLPDIGSAYGFSGKKEETEVYYSFTNYKMPSTTYRLNIKDGDSEVYYKSKAPFDPALYDSRQVFYTSKDGTKVPMIITYKKGTPMDGSAPTILYGYGGFNISLTPSFSPTRAAWLELGGVYAVANIRGGGEYGKEWHNAGIQMQKQNVFDDFIAAAEFLIDEKVTSSNKLAINGGSNGGLLVGAVMTQRPDLFKVALPAVGVLDMLRYHTFTAGAGWAYDYGTAEQSKEMFQYLKGYSPVHNVKAGVEYPATLITTGDHDDRVVPAHSYKFAAELQSKQAGSNPTLIRIETNAGHGAGTPTRKIIETNADIYSFALFNMGIEKLQ
ncbi:prolyl oligopeptidase family serine peptidase [Vibrio parahaemolyticus]|uniref:prolyl oligopeptidase family serine peptidase n=1 Tax=Vibrio parahaemolyticus TaxID=670 RepID=UPI001F4E3465|nr:prolyl oligopeptidase family serine peptidase [Vibrio parahaemolyticus]MEA5372913.1 prolyl oligopeptidase family serine peptidase [Vibrio parahaemolyticus]HCG8609034.1 S9 family peptidase [Vibrio parahaemolyticus]HCG8613933.1 S9 family peptidase [Vibrio parahaemolyticus]